VIFDESDFKFVAKIVLFFFKVLFYIQPFINFYTVIPFISVILWQSVLLVEEPGIPRETHRPATNILINSRQCS
jgi:hypothetical protein